MNNNLLNNGGAIGVQASSDITISENSIVDNRIGISLGGYTISQKWTPSKICQ